MEIIKEAIVLAGGLGTRLKSEVPDLPKCMAPVAGRPFIDYVIQDLVKSNIEKIIFALGYKYEIVLEHLDKMWPDLSYDYSVEGQPLGTGGAILLACKKITQKHFMVVNGDTLFSIDAISMEKRHLSSNAFITVALKPMEDFDRYGSVILDAENTILRFMEKSYVQKGIINGGIYMIDKDVFVNLKQPEKFSFEKDILEVFVSENQIKGFISDTYFIDIGIPEDFKKASIDLGKLS